MAAEGVTIRLANLEHATRVWVGRSAMGTRRRGERAEEPDWQAESPMQEDPERRRRVVRQANALQRGGGACAGGAAPGHGIGCGGGAAAFRCRCPGHRASGPGDVGGFRAGECAHPGHRAPGAALVARGLGADHPAAGGGHGAFGGVVARPARRFGAPRPGPRILPCPATDPRFRAGQRAPHPAPRQQGTRR